MRLKQNQIVKLTGALVQEETIKLKADNFSAFF
ncbi:hypothetical protein A33I_09670 [Alkalihalophilus marmarensis DSM 21297]|uniref:Uncharacterized protein n=1 Tax=Alkalihalophilus marmarensis DSM 21297 TaxID=1188261 RepID=U6SQB2_9BACI|nr:hypothetical protein A33I_09670 [Alkalihalophilus marmarensis DSM 21297]